jgi:hypothetical protein
LKVVADDREFARHAAYTPATKHLAKARRAR